ncbi:MAG: hypothetical protein K1X95_15140 [Acidimicrobiia bacterium]|nr:hypothetical protein [Acidimicrobiia bacterium]
MKQLSIRCDDELALAAKARADARRQSLNDYVLSLVAADLALPVMDEWIAGLSGDKPVRWRGSTAELVREDRDR